MAKLDLEWLGVFVEVYKTQSVSRAALRLGIEQASASIMLGKLRRHFDDRLFTRTSAGMEPTPKAQSIYPDLLEALLHIEKARGQGGIFLPKQAEREFHICMTDISEMVLLPKLINHLQQSAPGLTLRADKISPDSRRRLESGDVDLAVGFTPDLEAGFYQQALFAQNLSAWPPAITRASAPSSRRARLWLRGTSRSRRQARGIPSSTKCWPVTSLSVAWCCTCPVFWASPVSWRRRSFWSSCPDC